MIMMLVHDNSPEKSLLKLSADPKFNIKAFSGFPGGASGKEPTATARHIKMRVLSLGQEDPLKKGMATHSSIHA